MPGLFDPLELRGVTLPNRVAVSPMCQYSCADGFATDWHLVHLGSRAVGGAGLVMTEATAVTAEGRISPHDLGLWTDAHAEPLARIAAFVRGQHAVPGIQLAHAGRKASHSRPWDGDQWLAPGQGGWRSRAPSPIPFGENELPPIEMGAADIQEVIAAFARAAGRAHEAGFEVVELHAAHGYLLHEFLSPISNHRQDGYGGSFASRTRLLLESVAAVRAVWPDERPLFVRVSATDWVEGGWTLEDTVDLARHLKQAGVDLLDCSSGGTVRSAPIPVGAGYQVPFAEAIRRDAGIATGAVGMITDPAQADQVIRNGQADLVLLARALLRHPYWPLAAAQELRTSVPWPAQYLRATNRNTPKR